jgi:ribonuclease J
LPVHVSGHASQEEQKLLINLLKPRNFIPIHGELRQLKRHAAIAREMGIPEENIKVVENGQIIELVDGKLRLGERVPGGYVFVEGNSIGEIDFRTMREREQLARSGIVLIDLTVDKYSGRLLHAPEIFTRGFVSAEEEKDLVESLQKKVSRIVEGGGVDNEQHIMNAVRTFIYKQMQRRPMVFVTLSKA